MRKSFIRWLTLAAMCAIAVAAVAQTTSAAAQTPSVGPIAGTFTGSSNASGVVTSWNGALRFETAIGGDQCCGLTSGHVNWKIEGTDTNTGCTWSGSGGFSISGGKMAGIPTGASVSVSGEDYTINFDTSSSNGVPGYDQFGPVTEACPSTEPLTTLIHISDWINAGGAYKVKPGGHLSDSHTMTTALGTDSWRWNFTADTCSEPNVKTGKGYNKLSALMKGRLKVLYSLLDKANACYKFVVGFRNETTQKDLYDRWHQIADGHRGQKNLCNVLKAAGFAQCPSGWNPNGTARGGPAKPGSSRHEHAEAADIKVTFPPNHKPNNGKFRSAAHEAGLCGPPSSDPVHVEMPYRTKGQKTATCHFD